MIRLNKLLSQHGIASRRAADQLIEQGRVELNGAVVTALGTKADPAIDDIRVDGRRLKTAGERRYLLLYKPRGVVSTRTDPQRRQTVIDLAARHGVKGYLYPVGRLDFDSEGLLLLTNDGDFAARVTHPRYELSRTYEALVAGVPDDHDLDRLRRGIVMAGKRTMPAEVKRLRMLEGREGSQALLELTLREGRNRQVRDMCDAIGHPVDRLRRTRIGSLTDRGLRPGQLRDLTPTEVAALMGDTRNPDNTRNTPNTRSPGSSDPGNMPGLKPRPTGNTPGLKPRPTGNMPGLKPRPTTGRGSRKRRADRLPETDETPRVSRRRPRQ